MTMDGWLPIDTAPPETKIMLGVKEGIQLRRIGLGRISKPQDDKPIQYHWMFTVAPTHWKPLPT
jgi:hypothetical protein